MDEQIQQTDPVSVPVNVIALEDAQTIFDGYASSVEAGMTTLEGDMQQLGSALAAQSETGTEGVVSVSDAQWQTIETHMDYVRRSSSVSLFFSLLTLCVVSAVLGTRIWSTVSQGWRHG
jgi:hypothetical protein